VGLTIRLLGPPAIERDGEPVPPPRGRKAWALLATGIDNPALARLLDCANPAQIRGDRPGLLGMPVHPSARAGPIEAAPLRP
jgi:hypothetical protein